MSVNEPEVSLPNGPQRPVLSVGDVARQVVVDISGKEVQCAETLSHSWLGNQLGHITVGILAAGTLPLILRWVLSLVFGTHISPQLENIYGSLLVVAFIVFWEGRAYVIATREARGPFPLDSDLLRRNAIVAALYLLLGVALAYVYREFALADPEATSWWGWRKWHWAAVFFGLLVAIGAGAAMFWLRQKIIWQKAALPYISRLSTARKTMDDVAAKELQELIDGDLPPKGTPRQVIVGGPIGSGRTSIATSIGTEFAFKGARVRYLSMGSLLEFAAQPVNPNFADDPGPTNIGYWRWSQAQLIVIDDIAPLLVSRGRNLDDVVEQFRKILREGLGPIAGVLAKCHTVWVVGDTETDGFARAIREFCGSRQVLLMQLERDPSAPQLPNFMSIVKTRPPRARGRYVAG